MIYLTLFLTFFEIGLFTFGGGYAMISLIREKALALGWLTEEELLNMIAVSESSPGPIGVNMATYLGFQTGGVLCGIVSTLALVMPSIIVILIIARILEKFRESVAVKNLFYGLRAAVSGLLAVSVLNVFFQTFIIAGAESLIYAIDFKKLILFGVLLFGVFKFKKHPLLYIAIGAACGAIFSL